jgi:hypothetical protein
MGAYVLVTFNAGADLDQAHHARKRPGVKSVDLVLGSVARTPWSRWKLRTTDI